MTKFKQFAIPLVILLLCAVAIVPLLRADVPCSHDGAFHYYRVVAMRHAFDNDGILFTRYLPDLAFGYGYPFFNYRASSSYYLALALHLIGLALPVALNLVYVLSIAGSALATYLLARDLFGPQAGIVAALAYTYAPYQFLNALLRGNAPESLALPLMPLILWAFRRLALTGRRRWFLVSIGSLVALYLTHNISSLLFTPFLATYLLLLWLIYRREGHWLAAGGALIMALGLMAFFFAPALLEQDYAQLHMSHVTRNNDFHYNFLSLAEIFAPPTPIDTSLMNPPMHIHLGLVQTILSGLGLVIGLIRWQHNRERKATLIFLAVTALAMLWMSTRSSLWLWENIPLLPFIQFPWRLVGRAILPLAILASASFTAPTTTEKLAHIGLPQSTQTWLLALASCILIISALPTTYPPHSYCANKPYPAINDVFAYERESKLVGVDPEGSYFPVWVKQRPKDGSPLEKQYATSNPIARFDKSTLPTGAFIIEADYGPNQARIIVETPSAFRARYLAFYFPGWRVWIDDEPVQVTATDPEGLITFDVPAGNHTISVRFGSTPIRTAGTIVSILSLITLVIVTIRYRRITIGDGFDHTELQTQRPHRIANGELRHWPLVIVGVLMLILKLGIVDQTNTIFRRPALQPDDTLPSVERPLNQPYADGMTLIGYDQARATLPADDELRIDLYWTTHTRPAARYQTVIHLVGADGMRWSLPDTAHPRGYAKYPPNYTWSADRYALDSHQVVPLSGTPPGDYDIVLTIFDRDTLAPLSVLNEQGQPAAPELALGQVTLTRPRRPTKVAEDNKLGISGSEVTLLTADFDRAQAAPGDAVYLTLMWQAKRDFHYSQSTYCNWSLTLLHPDGTKATSYWLPPPPYSWKEKDVWKSQHQLVIPATLETNTLTWVVEWCSIINDPISQISITAPPHTYTAPPVDVEINTHMGDIATLIGTTLSPPPPVTLSPGHPLTVTLIWQAESTPHDSYHVFLHLLDVEGRLITQSDAIPDNWSRPTTGWLPGEYVTDTHTLTIPPDTPAGDYTLSTGLYVPGGERILTPAGADAIPLTTITVEVQP
ncbi:MAG: hypothetical protein GY832_19465 [Chloroflexi bacterium]|nr:hypothetical protein [Chloroflexota bacterium]